MWRQGYKVVIDCNIIITFLLMNPFTGRKYKQKFRFVIQAVSVDSQNKIK
jgi:predicted nucleic acid-binding protein